MSKAIGTPFENEVADLFRSHRFTVQRMPESDGRHHGFPSGVDISAMRDGELITVQCARRKSIAQYLTDKSEEADVLVLRENYGDPLFILTEESFFSLMDGRDVSARRVEALDRAIAKLQELRDTYVQ